MKCGLIGERLNYSYSKEIHALLTQEYSYELYPLKREELAHFLETTDCTGLNVTIPYKQAVIPYCREVEPEALRAGAVNTLVKHGGDWYGYNTDLLGFSALAKASGVSFQGRDVLILGTGATSRTAEQVARSEGARSVLHVSRTGKLNYENVYDRCSPEVLVNTTPVGTYPDTAARTVTISRFSGLCGVLDVVYNPLKTRLLLDAERMRLPHGGGLVMLMQQARYAGELFLGHPFPEETVNRVLNTLYESTYNVVFIGMPGSGKSAVGKRTAELLHRPFYDADAIVEEEAGCSVSEIFAHEGEEGFRARESAVLERLGRERGGVIAAGGGAVLKEENRDALRQNGFIVELTRPVSLLATRGRPLSKDRDTLFQMQKERAPYYAAARDVTIENTGINAAAHAAREAFYEACAHH